MRLNVQFTPYQNGLLDGMAEELRTTKADVLRKALSLFTIAVREQKAGNMIGSIHGNVVVKEIVIS